MSSLEKPSRRALVTWGLASAGLPLVSHALVPMADGEMKPNEIGARIGQTVPVPPGLQIFYRDEWFGAVAEARTRTLSARQLRNE